MNSAISVRHLTKDFRIGIRGLKLRAVDDLSLEIPRGQVYGLLGPNGCGKSTTLKVVLGLVSATAGNQYPRRTFRHQRRASSHRLPAGSSLFP